VLVGGPLVELMFAVPRALAPACALTDGGSVRAVTPGEMLSVEYHHLLLDAHAVIRANGMAAETLLMAPLSRRSIDEFETESLLPEVAEVDVVHHRPAALILKTFEARCLAGWPARTAAVVPVRMRHR